MKFKINIDDMFLDWKVTEISGEHDLFKNYHGKRLTKNKRILGKIPMLTAGASNNGVSSFIGNLTMPRYKSFISIDMFGNSFYHDYEATGDDNIYFFTNDELTKETKLFFVTLINKNKSKYSYGKQFRQKNADLLKIMMPVDKNSKIDFKQINNLLKQIINNKKNKYTSYSQNMISSIEYKRIVDLSDKVWKPFFIKDIMQTIQRGKRLTKTKQIKGTVPYISSTSLNNGVDNFINNIKNVRIFNHCLTIANSGSVGCTHFHPYEFVASDHVTSLENNTFNRHIYLFIATQLSKLSSRYNFNREINDKRISREKIMLPVNNLEEPDYEYMGQYMINIELEKRKQYLDYTKK